MPTTPNAQHKFPTPEERQARGKEIRTKAIALAAELAAPGAPRIYGTNFAYQILNSYNKKITVNAEIEIARWQPSGKVVTAIAYTSRKDDWLIRHQGTGYYLHHLSGMILPLDQPYPEEILAPELWADNLAKVTYPRGRFQSIILPRDTLKGDQHENNRRRYHRRQANALLRFAPEGYALLPGATNAVYKVFREETNGITQTFVSIYYPKANAHKFDTADEALNHDYGKMWTDIYFFKGRKYQSHGDSLTLIDTIDTTLLWASEDVRLRREFDSLRPKDKPVLQDELVWYAVTLGKRNVVQFNWYVNGKLQTETVKTNQRIVDFRDKPYYLSSKGELGLLQVEQQKDFLL